MLDITDEHVAVFERIKNDFLSRTKVPEENNWKSKTNNDIWLKMVIQVIVVGRSAPADEFDKSEKFKNEISYENLLILEQKEIKEKINQTLRFIGARYASSDVYKCPKTNALAYNFGVLKDFPNGPMDLLKMLSEIQGSNCEKMRINHVKNNFHYLKDKGARDFLMELGLIKNAIAIDSRVKNILEKSGINIEGKTYKGIERDVLDKICKPLELSGVQFDRMLYQNYKEIANTFILQVNKSPEEKLFKLLESDISPKAYQVFKVFSPDIFTVLEFFAMFSRFECALKSGGCYKAHDVKYLSHPRVEPEWKEYAKVLEGKPDIKKKIIEAAEYLFDQPPKIQIEKDKENKRIDWEKPKKNEDMGEIDYIFTLIKSVRNNLFHGGKFMGQDPLYDLVGEPERNTKLIQTSLKILEICLEDDGPVKDAFNQGLHS